MEDKKEKLEGLLIALDNLKETMTRAIGELSSRVEDALKEANKEQKPTVRVIPFDIEKAKQGAKVVTRDGYDVRVLCYDSKVNKDNPIIAETYGGSVVALATYSENGAYIGDGEISDHDLMIAEECV